MGAAGPAAAEAGAGRAAAEGPSADLECAVLAAAHRRALAGSARAVRALGDGVQPLPALAPGRGLGPGAGGAPSGSGRGRSDRLVTALRRWDERAGAPACGGGAKGGGDQALGRSRGGFSTKLHVRVERGGQLLSFT